jgi:hypothetical protein
MIKNIHPRGRYMQVIGGSASTYVNNYSGAQGVGNLRFNTSNQNLEVYDGNNWMYLNMPDTTVGLNDDAESLLDWVRSKRDQELTVAALATDHPAVKIALDNLERAKQQLDATIILSKEHEETTS